MATMKQPVSPIEETSRQASGVQNSFHMQEIQPPKAGVSEAETQAAKSKYEIDVTDLQMELSYIEDFIGKGKQFILKRQIQALGTEAKSVRCLEYERSVPEDMRMELFFLLDTGEIIQGYYNYNTRETTVERSTLTEDDVWALKEAEEQALKLEAEERERVKAEEEKKLKEEERKKAEAQAKKKAEQKAAEEAESQESEE